MGSAPSSEVTNAAIIVNVHDKVLNPVRGKLEFTLDGGAQVAAMAPDGAGIFLLNDTIMPISGHMTDVRITGGRYGIFIADIAGAKNPVGVTALDLHNTGVIGRDDAALRVGSGGHLITKVSDSSWLKGGTMCWPL